MSSILSSQGVVLATAMAVSGTVILLACRLQKSPSSTAHFCNFQISADQSLPPSCIISSGEGKRKEKKKKKKKKVHFAEDVVDPTGNSDEYRRKMHSNNNITNQQYSNSNSLKKGGKMPANRVALYNGILRDRIHRVA